ncbi:MULTISPECIES: Gfo/Idh/MocA family oxidoreductase [unclassified Paraburkholderia]|uniref:Gfo/Idh/MocA family protein n=1 Tax=unclassified Paraburkholderia TaxID=2615204 RepID=UPI002AB30396|nr:MULTISPECIES: Gfo/Idh/MocA family oxidoreductase [unclassified Paraburkholderia]
MRRFNVGVLGIGDISDVYIANLRKYPIVNVLGCAGREREKALEKARHHGIERAYASADELLADADIDIVLNLTVPQVHAELTLAALCAGKHVYSEKPLGTTFDEGKRIVEMAHAKGLYVACAPDTFLGGRLQTFRKLIDAGTIGRVFGATAFAVSRGPEWFHPDPAFIYQRGGGPLLDIGPYYLSALASLLGPVRRCSAIASMSSAERVVESAPRAGELFKVEEPTHVSAMLEFESGAHCSLIFSYDVWDSALPRLEIYGDAGTLCMSDPDPCDGPNIFGGRVLLRTRRNYRWKDLPRSGVSLSDWEDVAIEHRFNETSHRENSRGIGLVDMAYAIAGERAPRASAAMALHVQEVMDGILASARSGRSVAVETTFLRPDPFPLMFPESAA